MNEFLDNFDEFYLVCESFGTHLACGLWNQYKYLRKIIKKIILLDPVCSVKGSTEVD
jgi:hypothetical protein